MPSAQAQTIEPFLRRELAPFPGRGVATARVVVACVAVLILCMTLRVPEAYLSVWVVTRFAMEDSSQTLLTGIVFLVALTVGLALAILLLIIAMDQPALRFVLIAAMAGAGLFLRRTFLIGALGFVIGLIGTLILTVPDFIPVPELAIRGSLWLWPVFALGIAAAVAANLFIVPTDPEGLLRAEIRERLRATEESLSSRVTGVVEERARPFAMAGVTRLLALLRSAALARASVRARHAHYGALITLSDRFVTAAATLERMPAVPETARLEQIAAECAYLRRVFDARCTAEPWQRPEPSAVSPVVDELEQAVDQLQQALGPEGKTALATGSETERPAWLVKDAFTNRDHLHYALKGVLAVMICYVLQSAVDWPGIRTCIVTCLIVGLGSDGATIQKGSLRITGALVGAVMGFAAILLLIPRMESITSLALLVAAGTAVAAWVVVGSPRIAYVGVQIAFAFYVCVIQGFEPTWHFDTIRDRLLGILLGNVVITLVFHFIWPVRAAEAIWKSFGSGLRAMAALASVGSGNTEGETLRLQALRDFAAAQQAADEAAFEPSAGDQARERAQRAVADAQSVLLTQLAVASQRTDARLSGFDSAVAESLTAIADRLQQGRERSLPDFQLAALESPLERELVQRIQRLAFEVAQ
jgi:multidrug resistance protein MdtO